MSTLHEEINDFITNRIQQAYQEILDDPDFKTIRKNILSLEEHVRNSLSPELRESFDEYCELIGQRSGIMEEKTYRTGFSDGINLKNIMVEVSEK